MNVTVTTKDGVKHVHTLIEKFQIYEFYSFSEGNNKEFQLYGYNIYKSYKLKDISDIDFDFDAN